jgi:hypothetical protein
MSYIKLLLCGSSWSNYSASYGVCSWGFEPRSEDLFSWQRLFVVFLQSLHSILPQIKPRTLPYTIFPINYSQIILPLRVTDTVDKQVINTWNDIIRAYTSYRGKVKLPCNRPWRPIGLWDVEVPTFSLDNRLTDGGKVSLTCRPPFTPPGRFLVVISVRGWVDPRAIVRLEGLGQLKKIHLIGTRIRDLPACSTVPQPTTLPRAPPRRVTFKFLRAVTEDCAYRLPGCTVM